MATFCSGYRRWKGTLLDVGWSYATLRPDVERPAMRGSSFIHHGALHALVNRADKQRERAATGVTGAGNSVLVHFGARCQVVDGPHPIPHAIMRQVLAHQQQRLAGHGMFGGRVAEIELVLAGFRIPVLPALA